MAVASPARGTSRARGAFRAIVAAVALACGGCGGGQGGGKPLDPAQNTVPFTGGIYFVGLWQQQAGLQRFWPTRATSYYTGFQTYANPYFVFRPSDDQLFYAFQPYGIFVDDSPSTADSAVPTPPCTPGPSSGGILAGNFELPFGFDAQNHLYYYCNANLRDGVEIDGPPPGYFYVGALGDGRMVVSVTDATGDPSTATFAAMGPDGSIISKLDHGLPPPYELLPESITVQGNDAFVLVAPLGYDQLNTTCISEVVAYRLDPQSNWLRVRSIPMGCDNDDPRLVLSDGTVLVWTPDTYGTPTATAYLPDGTKRLAWTLADSPGAEADEYPAMVVGPREPSGPSLRQE